MGQCDACDSLSAAVEVQRLLQESRKAMKAALAWLEKSCTLGVLPGVYVRLEHGQLTFRDEDPPTGEDFDGDASDWNCSRFDVDGDTPGRSVVEGIGVLFLRAQSGKIARLTLQAPIEATVKSCSVDRIRSC